MDKLQQLFDQDLTDNEIAAVTECSKKAVDKWRENDKSHSPQEKDIESKDAAANDNQ